MYSSVETCQACDKLWDAYMLSNSLRFPRDRAQVLPEFSEGVAGVTIELSSLSVLMLFPSLHEAEAVFMTGVEVKVKVSAIHVHTLKR